MVLDGECAHRRRNFMAKAWNLARFNLDDLYQLALALEKKGYEFYGKLVDGSEGEQVQNELAYLRDEEAAHQAFFEGELAKKGKKPGAPSPELDALLAREFLDPLQAQLGGQKVVSFKDALRFGMDLEQKTIDFYNALKAAHSPGVAGDLDAVIAQEEQHKRKLKVILAY
jgi:rubrerythrin